MTPVLEASYDACRRITSRAARNFYYSFWALPREKRRAMCALYAFFRRTDDLGDCDAPSSERRAALQQWHKAWHESLADEYADTLLPAIVDTVRRYQIPTHYLETAIDGVESDLDRTRFLTFDELADYCYQVASVVGLASIHVWGFRKSEEACVAAGHCGLAFQLTNILRDVREDASYGRIYLPQEDLARFGLTDDDILHGPERMSGLGDDRIRELFRFQTARAADYYQKAAVLLKHLEPDGVGIYTTMLDIYGALLEKVRLRDGFVFDRRITLSPWHKLSLVARNVMFRPRQPTAEPDVRQRAARIDAP